MAGGEETLVLLTARDDEREVAARTTLRTCLVAGAAAAAVIVVTMMAFHWPSGVAIGSAAVLIVVALWRVQAASVRLWPRLIMVRNGDLILRDWTQFRMNRGGCAVVPRRAVAAVQPLPAKAEGRGDSSLRRNLRIELARPYEVRWQVGSVPTYLDWWGARAKQPRVKKLPAPRRIDVDVADLDAALPILREWLGHKDDGVKRRR